MPGGSDNRQITFIRVDTVLLANLRADDDPIRPYVLRQQIDRATTYTSYLAPIEGLRNALELDEHESHKVEMLLFALSDTVVYQDFLEAVRRNN